MSQFVQAAFFVSPNFQYQYEKNICSQEVLLFQEIVNVESSSLEIFHFGVCKWGEAVNHFTLKVSFFCIFEKCGKKDFSI